MIWLLQFVLCFFEYVFSALLSGYCFQYCSHLYVQASFQVVVFFLNSCISFSIQGNCYVWEYGLQRRFSHPLYSCPLADCCVSGFLCSYLSHQSWLDNVFCNCKASHLTSPLQPQNFPMSPADGSEEQVQIQCSEYDFTVCHKHRPVHEHRPVHQ